MYNNVPKKLMKKLLNLLAKILKKTNELIKKTKKTKKCLCLK